MATAWLALVLAGLLEIGWALGLKFSDGFTRFWPSVATVVAIVLSFGMIGISLKSLHLARFTPCGRELERRAA